jgi:hypothetical protein
MNYLLLLPFAILYCEFTVAGVPTEPSFPNRTVSQDKPNLVRWMASYLAIEDVECSYKFFTINSSGEPLASLLQSNPTKDERGYYLTQDYHFKFRPRDRWYFRDGFHQVAGVGGRFKHMLFAHDGDGHRTFGNESYSGVIRSDESISFRLLTHPFHYVSLDVDLLTIYENGGFNQESELVYTATIPIGEGNIAKFYLSPENGYMPKRIEAYNLKGQLEIQFDVEQFHQVNGLWFPIVGKRTFHRENATHLLEIRPETLKINQGLTPKDFRFEFPQGSAYEDTRSGKQVVGAEFTKRQNEKSAAAAAGKPKYTPPSSEHWGLFVGLGIVVLVTIFFIIRRFSWSAVLLLALPFNGCDFETSRSAEKTDSSDDPINSRTILNTESSSKTTVVSADDSGVYQQEFVIRNDSLSSAQITDVSSNCGCMSATIDRHTIPPNGSAVLKLAARVEHGIKTQVLAAQIEATDGVQSGDLPVLWKIERSSNWRPFQNVFQMNAMVGEQITAGPFNFEISADIDSPEIKIEDEENIFEIADDLRIYTDEDERLRIEFELLANPKSVVRAPKYMIRVSLANGEPSYYLLICDLQVHPRAYFKAPIIRIEKDETELRLESTEKPSSLVWNITPPSHELTWEWDQAEQYVRLFLKRIDSTESSEISELKLSVIVEGENLEPACTLVSIRPTSFD